jgi:hypothetical protein
MGIKFQVLKYVPSIGAPDAVLLNSVMSGNYVPGQGGTTVDLNPGTFSDPNSVGVLGEPLNQPTTPPSIESCQLAAGVYAQLTPGATLATNKISLWTNNNAELGNTAYPAGTLVVKLPLR